MYLMLIFVPLASSVLCLMFGRFFGNRGSSIITTGSLFITLFFSSMVFFEVGLSGSPCYIELGY